MGDKVRKRKKWRRNASHAEQSHLNSLWQWSRLGGAGATDAVGSGAASGGGDRGTRAAEVRRVVIWKSAATATLSRGRGLCLPLARIYPVGPRPLALDVH
jgi:hypothetical protein